VWTFAEHKTAKRTGRSPVIYLTPAMSSCPGGLVGQYPEGRLFRGPRSKRGLTRNGVRCRFRAAAAETAHLKG